MTGGGTGSHALSPACERLKAVFKKYDTNGQGLLSRAHCQEVMVRLCGNMTEEEINVLLEGSGALMGDGQVNYVSFVDHVFGDSDDETEGSASPKTEAVSSRLFGTPRGGDQVHRTGARRPSLVKARAVLPPRPSTASGTFLRIITVNDIYKLDYYPRLAAVVESARDAAGEMDCVVSCHLNGDYLSPCLITALDGGKTMVEALNLAGVDYACLGNHEFDIGFHGLRDKMKLFKGKCVNSNAEVPEINFLPKYSVLWVGEKCVLIGGFVTGDKSIYSPVGVPNTRPIPEACMRVWEQAKRDLKMTPDLFLPMTHQTIGEDRTTAESLGRHYELAHKTPIILGGHEHEVFIEEAGHSLIVKVGIDSEKIGIVDMWWTPEGHVRHAVSLIPATDFPLHFQMQAFVQRKKRFLEESMNVVITQLPYACSSKKVRYEESGLAKFLLDIAKRGLAHEGVDLVMVQGGSVRGKADYEAGDFTLANLYAEFSFSTDMAIVPLRGSIIAEAIHHTRSQDGEKPCFLQTDSGVEVSPDHRVIKINGQPINPEKTYTAAVFVMLLWGMNDIGPLVSYASVMFDRPTEESCKPLKQIICEVCMKDAWRALVGYDTWDKDGNGAVDPQELRAAVHQLMHHLDKDGDGTVDSEELSELIAEKGMQSGLVPLMMSAIDRNEDGRLSREEIIQMVF